MSSIIKWIRSNIKKNVNENYYDHKTDQEVAGMQSTWVPIKDEDINHVIWTGVAKGGSILNSRFNGAIDSDGDLYQFGPMGTDSWSWNEWWLSYSDQEEDIDFLLTGLNGDAVLSVLGVDNYSPDELMSTYFYTIWFGSNGLYDNIKNHKDYGKELKNGINNDDDIRAVSNLLKLHEKYYAEDPSGYRTLYDLRKTTLDELILILKRNLIRRQKDIHDIYSQVPKESYSFNKFVAKVSIAVSYVLDYGPFTQNDWWEAYTLDEGDLKLKPYDLAFEALFSEDKGYDISETFLYLENNEEPLVWRSKERDNILYPTSTQTLFGIEGNQGAQGGGGGPLASLMGFDTDNDWLKQIPTYKGEEDDTFEMPDQIQGADLAIIDFLKNEGDWKYGWESTGNRFNRVNVVESNKTVLSDTVPDHQNFAVSNRRTNGEPKNLLEYDKSATGLWDKHHQVKILLEPILLDAYIEFGVNVQTENLVASGNQNFFDLTKSIDKEAFGISEKIAKIIAINKLNLIKAALFVSLKELVAEEDNDSVIDKAIGQVADSLNEGAELNYEDDETNEQELADRLKLLEQCALLLNLRKIDKDYINYIKHNKNAPTDQRDTDIHIKSGFFGQRFFRISGQEPVTSATGNNKQSTTLTALHSQGASVEPFLKISPVLQSLLVPKIKIQKIVSKGEDTYTIDVPFTPITTGPDNRSIDYVSAIGNPNQVFRGGGVGIKKLSLNFDGETPATAQIYVKGTLSLKFQDFKDLVTDRNTFFTSTNSSIKTTITTFRYIDLLVNTPEGSIPDSVDQGPCNGDGENSQQVDSFLREYYSPTNYRIKVDVGWSLQDDNSTRKLISNQLAGTPYTDQDFYDAVQMQNKTFMLAALDHDIVIAKDGSVDVNINYFGFPDALLSSYKFNALVSNKEESEVKSELEDLLCQISSGQCSKTQVAKLQRAIENTRQERLKKSMQNIMKRMYANRLVHKVTIDDPDQINTFKTNGSFSKIPKITTSLNDTISEIGPYSGKKFIMLGDLLYVLLDCLYEKSGKKVKGAENIVPVLTDFDFSEYLTDGEEQESDKKIVKINLASIPISLAFFKEWFTDEVIASEKYVYPVMEFILVLCNRLLGDMLTEVCFNKKSDKMLYFRQATLHGNFDDLPGIRYAQDPQSIDKAGILTTQFLKSSNLIPFFVNENNLKDASKIANYVIIYCDTKPEYHDGKGNYVEDLENGIYHFYVGANKGILKDISFQKTNITYLRESRMYRYQGLGDFAQLSNVYNVSLKLFGNFLFFPGMQIFINPFGVGGAEFGKPQDPLQQNGVINFAKLMGIGGYHLVKNVSIDIGPSGFETSIEAIFIFSGDVSGNGNGIDGFIPLEPAIQPVGIAAGGTDTAACAAILSQIEGVANSGE